MPTICQIVTERLGDATDNVIDNRKMVEIIIETQITITHEVSEIVTLCPLIKDFSWCIYHQNATIDHGNEVDN